MMESMPVEKARKIYDTERCRGCAYLLEADGGWWCDACGRFCADIPDCEAIEIDYESGKVNVKN